MERNKSLAKREMKSFKRFLNEKLKIELDIRNGAGSIPWVVDIFNEKYRGFTAKVKCSKFLEMALDDEVDELERRSLNIIKAKAENEVLKISPIYIQIDISELMEDKDNPKIKVIGHEGRARAYLIKREMGNTYWPIAIHIDNYRMRQIPENKRIKLKELLNTALVKEGAHHSWVIKDSFKDIDLP